MQAQKVGAVLVCEEDRLVGVFTERDVLRLMAERADMTRPVGEVMSSDPQTVTDSDDRRRGDQPHGRRAATATCRS